MWGEPSGRFWFCHRNGSFRAAVRCYWMWISNSFSKNRFTCRSTAPIYPEQEKEMFCFHVGPLALIIKLALLFRSFATFKRTVITVTVWVGGCVNICVNRPTFVWPINTYTYQTQDEEKEGSEMDRASCGSGNGHAYGIYIKIHRQMFG